MFINCENVIKTTDIQVGKDIIHLTVIPLPTLPISLTVRRDTVHAFFKSSRGFNFVGAYSLNFVTNEMLIYDRQVILLNLCFLVISVVGSDFTAFVAECILAHNLAMCPFFVCR